MVKRVNLDSVDEKIRKFLKKLKVEEDQYILEISGKPLIGVVPPWQVGNVNQKKADLLSLLKDVWAKTSDIPEEKVEKEVEDAVKAVRKSL
ncbi:MAG: hypothetical protein ACE5KZ_00105 [Candidatus Scalinduaceae bacterium]